MYRYYSMRDFPRDSINSLTYSLLGKLVQEPCFPLSGIVNVISYNTSITITAMCTVIFISILTIVKHNI